ncbi:serine/threonine-protein kinase [Schlesneria sp.]|uniref:serine/threonine-protein kinase n=1 Tax=Schlesneria sp. TaxID=2762018 RepID=UPI002EED7815
MRFTYQSGAQPLAGFTIQRGIHRGGFGEVYYARSDGGKDVALKLLHQQDQDIEIRGVTQCLNLKHSNLITLFDVKTDEHGDYWVVMEYVAGSSLEDVLASFPDGLPLAEVAAWLDGLVAGVAHLHDRGIVHRDLKPGNVYRENGVVKVGDVGLSKRLGSDHRRQHTQSVGTVYYMAPEVARGQYGPEVDVYSLGVMLYEMITGRLPFTGETTAEILMKHLTAQPDLTPVPRELRPTVARALEKDPTRRTATVRELGQDFWRATQQHRLPMASAAEVSSAAPLSGEQFPQPTADVASSEPTTIPANSFLPPLPRGSQSANSPAGVSSEAPWRRQHADLERKRQPGGGGTSNSRSTRSEPWLQPEQWLQLCIVLGMVLLLTGSLRGAFPLGGVRSTPVLGFVIIALLVVPTAGIAALHSLKLLLYRITDVDPKQKHSPRPGTAPYSPPAPSYPEVRAEFVSSGPARRAAVAVAVDPRFPFDDRPWPERLPELANSLGYAGLVASLLSAGVYAALSVPLRQDQPLPFMPRPESAILFMATAIVGSWLILIGHTLSSGSHWTNRQRWLLRLATGAVIGSIAYALDEFLLVNYSPSAYSARSLFRSLGGHPLIEGGSNPTWLAYSWFFAGWLGLRRWSQEMDLHRKVPFRMGTVMTAILTAFLMSWVFRFPQVYAMLWAGTISMTVQLASRWSPLRSVKTGATR